MTRKLKIYSDVDYGNVFLPADIVAALAERPHVRQGNVYVWATTAKAAAERLNALGIGVRSARALRVVDHPAALILDSAQDWPEGTVLVTRMSGGGPVVEIVNAELDGDSPRDIPIVRVTNYNTVINHVNTTYAADEKKATADPKTSGYSSASGKKYNGTTVPRTAFKGSNVPVSGPAGDAPTAKKTGPTTPATKAATPTAPKAPSGSYSKPRSSTTTSRSSSGHSGSSHSSGGHH